MTKKTGGGGVCHRAGAPRRLPDDATLSEILASGAFYAEIARRYAVTDDAVAKHARRLGFEPIPPGQRQGSRRHRGDSRVDCGCEAAVSVPDKLLGAQNSGF